MATATSTLRKIWRNEYFQTILMIVIMIMIVFGFWYGTQLVLKTQYPALAVVSTSMLPTLNVGDIIIVQGVPASEIKADYSTGDIIVYRKPGTEDFRIVHRAVIKENRSDGYYFVIKGDNNAQEDFNNQGGSVYFHESYIIGKVIARIPYIGNIALFINALGNFYYILIVLIIIINILLSLIPEGKEKNAHEQEHTYEKRKFFGKLSLRMLFFIAINVLLIGFMIFNLFGSFTFWQIGAEPPQNVPVLGMYSDFQYQSTYGEIFKRPHNNVTDASLFQGFMTYQINCLVNGSERLGVPTFSWAQASILILLLFDSWIVAKSLHLDKRIMQALKRNPT